MQKKNYKGDAKVVLEMGPIIPSQPKHQWKVHMLNLIIKIRKSAKKIAIV